MKDRKQFAIASPGVEGDLLLCCARTTLDQETVVRLENCLRTPVNWHLVTKMAQSNQIMSLFYWHLKDRLPVEVPADVSNYLQRSFRMHALKNEILSKELLRILSLLEAEGIQVVPFKGPVLAESVYGNLSLRQFCDLDILVEWADAYRARDLLLADQYRPYRDLSSHQEARLFRDRHAYTLRREDGRVDIDLHWRFAPTWASSNIEFDLGTLRQRLKTVEFNGREILGLPAEELLLVLCMHGAKEIWPNLRMICDVNELLQKTPDIDWGCVMQEARRLECERILYLGLLLAESLLEAPVPKYLLDRASGTRSVTKVAARIPSKLFGEQSGAVRNLEKSILIPRLMDRRIDRITSRLKLLRKNLTPNERDMDIKRLPAALNPIFWILRPVRLILDYGKALLRHVYRRDRNVENKSGD